MEIRLAFDDSALVFRSPIWAAPALIWLAEKVGASRLLRMFALLPHHRKRLGLCAFGPQHCTFDRDRTHCLLMVREWPCFAVYRALTDRQRVSWHGCVISIVSPPSTPHE